MTSNMRAVPKQKLRRKRPAEVFIDDPLVGTVDRLVPEAVGSHWSGTATQLLRALAPLVSATLRNNSVFWPQNAKSLGIRTSRMSLSFRARGLSVARSSRKIR